MLFFIFVVGLLLFGIYRIIKFWILDSYYIQKDFSNQGIPGQYIPIVGDILDRRRGYLADDPLAFSEEMAAKFGNYYYSSFGPKAYLSISDPSLIDGVLKTNVRSYHKSALGQAILTSLLGYENLLLAEDENHTRHRRLIAPVFQHQNINSMISLMTERTSRFLDKWKTMSNDKNQPLTLDIHQEISNLTLDIITGCVFGTDIIKDQHTYETICQSLTVALKEIEKRVFNMLAIIPILNRLPLRGKVLIDQSKRNIKNAVQNIINQRKQGLTKSACKGPDLLDLILMAQGDEKTRNFTDEEVSDEAITFVLAGHETGATLMSWTLYNLANNPDAYHRCQAEVDSLLDDDESVTASTISLLTYTEAVLKETLRYHQPVPILLRTAVEDNTIVASDGKHIHIKKGTDIAIHLNILHRSEKYWDEPNKFDPSRFDGRKTGPLLPFSSGPRSCIGQNFAMLEAKIMLALIIKRFNFELVPGQKHVPDIAITIRPKYGMSMRISPR